MNEQDKNPASVIIITILVTLAIISLITVALTPDDPIKADREQQIKAHRDREQQIEEQFSAWDGSHIKLEIYIKDRMNDPDSYEHVETRYLDMNDYLVVQTTFRGNNAFGGKIKQTKKAKVELRGGHVIEIMEE